MTYFCKPESLETEGDVEFKLLVPLLMNREGLGYFQEEVKNKSYMAPTQIDKGAGKKRGYYPDYSVILYSLPILVIEVKEPGEKVEQGFKEAQLYAHEANKRFEFFNPVEIVIACNGKQLLYGPWDSEAVVAIDIVDLIPGCAAFEEFRIRCGRATLMQHAKKLRDKILPKARFKAMNMTGGTFKQKQTLEANQFARELAPIFREYFDTNIGRTDIRILDRAYVATQENTHYDGILESLLKDNLTKHKHPDFELLETSRKDAAALDLVVKSALASVRTSTPMILLIGNVGSGKSIFIDKYYQTLMSDSVRRRSVWILIDFNFAPGELLNLDAWIVDEALRDLPERNKIPDFHTNENLNKYFGLDIKDLKETYKKTAEKNPDRFDEIVEEHLAKWKDDKNRFLKAVINHYGSDRGVSVVVVFDNADKRDAEQQLKIFQAVQHFRSTHKCFCLLSLRDVTYDRYKDEPPLDAFYKPYLFRIQPAHFLDIARKRLDLVIEDLGKRAPKRTTYTLSNGANVELPASELGNYLLKIYNSLFNPQKSTRYIFEALAGRNMRAALEMFAEIVMSPHFETDKIFATRFKTEPDELQDWMIIRILMKKNFMYYNSNKSYITNLFDIDEKSGTATIFLLVVLLHRLAEDRKSKGELNIEGYRHVEILIGEVSNQGYLSEDVLWGLEKLLQRNLIDADHQRNAGVDRHDYVKITASGWYHLKSLIAEPEYVNGISMDVWLRDQRAAEELAQLGDLSEDQYDVNFFRIHAKLERFNAAISGEATLHYKQSSIESDENEAVMYAVNAIGRSVRWKP